ncbi:hypothetical protein HCY58_11555 [Acinetobacter radioresistens]|uniref:hypothetical protein n=1 Tax=Acinetobacter radioresistens TaxID=40216 RepID=UPI002003CA44|nr:hypothetical protein [Acinetobacter radioresistens]MCK4087682.1 hypothetical protein [Acinetobacter radioresistens]MCK4093533.1 hypothetical protein [Acinetobacter radioresistens]
MQTLESLKITAKQAKFIIKNAPACPDAIAKEIYWHFGIDKYFTQGRRNNARLHVTADTWQTATRYNSELDDMTDRFIKLSDLKKLVE